MRRTSFALMALAFLLSAGAVEAQTLKIAYINSQEILLQAPGAEEAQQAFDDAQEALESGVTPPRREPAHPIPAFYGCSRTAGRGPSR